ncbi:MAG: hypothetical protein L0Y64_19800, partial [Myxococcaceae bacterium]|nr:hypothetical protein [Myxococcaceae bacterium]
APLLTLVLLACTPDTPGSGSEPMGTFVFERATLVPEATDCFQVPDAPDGEGGYALIPQLDGSPPMLDGGFPPADFARELEGFEGTFSRKRDSGDAVFTLRDMDRAATFDGQVLSSTATSPRRFDDVCGPRCKLTLEETFTVALLSASQEQAVGRRCPPDALDGGVPGPDEDAGIRPPMQTSGGFDATRACGLLVESVQPQLDCTCRACTVVYRLEGSRK